ncbi:sensor histidine kinase [Novosphingobium album (ex Liu et al. 2023)]|uniref:histidine kinase n=1 Tax=Novosphingobium album (ex Liu et al. 2023) TaxID=3031130 RepID=A0ABT5WPK4_9SPHN|nr:HAMP domain-containing sensor histidine kinase [Novosphingobium album (ex Liu et al. 2023)]MDE8651207.1 HAMP domain-containing sensor histidine kinase [Novosphingobium album (ex Liu et al. 2023)]
MFGSLRARLTGAVMLPLAALVVIFGGIACWVIAKTINVTSDRVLVGSVRTLSVALDAEPDMRPRLVPLAVHLLQRRSQPATFYSIHHGDKLVAGLPALTPPPGYDATAPRADHRQPAAFPDSYRKTRMYSGYGDPDDAKTVIQAAYLRDGKVGGKAARIATEIRLIEGDKYPFVVQVGDYTDDRSTYIFSQSLQVIGGGVLILMIAMLLFYQAIIWGLKPFSVLTEQVEEARREPPAHFRLVQSPDTPREAVSFILAFNALMERMEKAAESLRQFTTNASHQMRTPLAIARVHLGLLDRFGPNSPQGQTALQDISHAIQSLERLLQQLISLARTDEQAIDPTMSFDLAATAATVLGERIGHFSEFDIDVIYEQDEDGAIAVKGHPLLAAELISNLVDNAIRYNRPGGSVVVRLGRHDGRGRIEIEDDGPGIPEEYRERVWERFYRGVAENDQVGSGLGLSIVSSLAERMGARVSLNNGANGCGVCATVEFQEAA